MQKLKRLECDFSKKGFTVLEIIVTLGIVVLVLTLALVSLTGSVKGTKDASAVSSADFEIMRVYGQMRKQLLSMYQSPNTDLKSFVQTKEIEPRMASIRFFTTSSAQGAGTVEVFYSIQKDDDGNNYLAYREYPMTRDMEKAQDDGDFKEEISEVFSKKIKGMRVVCEESEKDVDLWDKKTIPDKIKIIFYYEVQKREEKFEFSVTPAIKMF